MTTTVIEEMKFEETEFEETEADGVNGFTTEARSERRRTEAVTLSRPAYGQKT